MNRATDYTEEALCRVWLQCSPAVSWNMTEKLLSRFGSAAEIWRHFDTSLLPVLGEQGYHQLEGIRLKGLDAIALALGHIHTQAVTEDMEGYPARLRTIPDPPHALFVRGELPAEDLHAVAIVGSRRDTRYGRTQARRIARQLAEAGVVIVSGLARGIDTAAHEGALDAHGKTVAVLGNGIKSVYPPENADLAERILQNGGAVLSEFAPDAEPLAYHFPIRNRIISGLADALLLIEAQKKSGTASTVNHALNQGKEVFALPGNVDAPGSELPLQLLREGAQLCVDADDILSFMRWQGTQQTSIGELLSPPEGQQSDPILAALALEEKTFEELADETGLPLPELNARLTMLEIEGSIEKRGGRAYCLVRER